MESNAITTWAQLVVYFAGAAWLAAMAVKTLLSTLTSNYGKLISDLQNDGRERDVKIIALEHKAEAGEQFRGQMYQIAEICPITEKPCPLRGLLFKRPS